MTWKVAHGSEHMVTSYGVEERAAGAADSGAVDSGAVDSAAVDVGRISTPSGADCEEASLATTVSGGAESEGTAAAASAPVLSLSTSVAAHRKPPKLEELLNTAPRANCVAIGGL